MVDGLDWWRSRIQPPPYAPAPNEYPENDEYDFQQRLYDNYASTVTALLLSLCPNIKTFYIGSSIRRGLLEDYLLKSNYGLVPRPALQELKHVRHHRFEDPLYDSRYYDAVELLDIIRYFHRLPQVTGILMDAVSDYQPERQLFPPKTSTSIKKIHLGYSDISSEMLATLIRIPIGLQELSLSFYRLNSSDRYMTLVDLAFLAKSLRQHKDTLRVLGLDLGSAFAEHVEELDEEMAGAELEDERLCDKYFHLDKAISTGSLHPHHIEDSREYGNKIGSLRDYTTLTQLSISIRAILGEFIFNSVTLRNPPAFRLVDALPPNLEYLCLYGYEKGKSAEMDSHVMELLEGKGERLPKLKEIVGVDETVPGTFAKPVGWTGELDEEGFWEREVGTLGWVEV